MPKGGILIRLFYVRFIFRPVYFSHLFLIHLLLRFKKAVPYGIALSFYHILKFFSEFEYYLRFCF
jgi:hypothetical protein